MAAGLVSHNITTASGVTFAVVSWVPDTTAPDVGAVPVARITDGVNVAPVSATNGVKVDVAALPNVTVNGIPTTASDRGTGAATANTQRVAIVNEQVEGGHYEGVPASATTTLGATGAAGDFLSSVIIVPGTTSPGAVSIKDGSDAAISIFTGGATSVSNLVPFAVPVGATSRTGAWQLVLGANVTAVGTGKFT